MARKKIREYDSKRLLREHLKRLAGIDLQICSAQVTESTDFTELTNKEPWLSSTKLVVKPDMLFGKRGKSGLVALNLDLAGVAEFVKTRLGVEVEMGGCKAPITTFIVEPFVPHDQEYYLSIVSERLGCTISFSECGGIEIEENWDKVKTIFLPTEKPMTLEACAPLIATLAEEAKLAREEIKPTSHAVLSICKSLFAGGVAGGVSRTAVAPLERLKILLQVQNPHNIKYNGTIQGLKYIWRTEGFKGLFKGNGTNCARIVPNSAVKFFSYEQASKGILYLYRQQTGNEDAQLTPLLRLGAGACAGIIAMSATYPMDMVRGRLTVQTENSPYQYRGMFHALSTVLREEGPRALYKGWTPSVIGVIPYVGLNFAVYESLKDWLVKTKPFGLVDNSELGVVTRLACGAAAGTVGQTVAYPLDVIRRRMQMVGWSHAASIVTGDGRSKAPLEYTGMIDAFRKTVKYEGVRALYKGLVPNSVKVVPSISIAFVAYEQVKDLLGVEIRISD